MPRNTPRADLVRKCEAANIKVVSRDTVATLTEKLSAHVLSSVKAAESAVERIAASREVWSVDSNRAERRAARRAARLTNAGKPKHSGRKGK